MNTTTTTTTGQRLAPANDYKVKARLLYPGRCGGFTPWVRELAEALMGTTPPPPEGIMSHHGLYFPWRGLTLTIAPHGPGTLRLSLERNLSRCDWKRAHGRKAEAGLKARTWKRLQDAAASAFGKPPGQRWNGADGSASASMLIQCPEALQWMHQAVANYGALPSVFDYGDETRRLFSMVGDWHRGILDHYKRPCRAPVVAYHRIDAATIWCTDAPTAEALTIKGRIHRPLDHPIEARAEAFKAALGKLHDIGRVYFPEGALAITTDPTPRP